MANLSENQGRAVEAFRRAGGILRTCQALGLGIHPRDLYALRDLGILSPVSRGIYRLSDLPPLREPDLVTVAARVPRAVVCLISALHFHALTPEIPHVVSIALPRATSTPKLAWPPITVYRFSPRMFEAGIENHERDGVAVRIYSPAKTIADCFKFRRRLGADVALEALRLGLSERRVRPAEVMHFARICRVEKVIKPFLEALV